MAQGTKGSFAGSKHVTKQSTGNDTVTTNSFDLQTREGGGNHGGGKRVEVHGSKKARTIAHLNKSKE